jgi:hypothetical protein
VLFIKLAKIAYENLKLPGEIYGIAIALGFNRKTGSRGSQILENRNSARCAHNLMALCC